MLRDGKIDANELEEFQQLSNKLLSQQTAQLNGNPTTNNMKGVLETLGNAQLLNADSNSKESSDAFNALSAATEKRFKKAEKNFRRNPTKENLVKKYEEQALGQQLSGNVNDDDTGFKSVGDAPHIIVKGDTLSKLSKQYYGDYNFWDKILIKNFDKIRSNTEQLSIGTQLIIS